MELGIIGFGPRGLSALESLVSSAIEKKKFKELKVSIFEPRKYLGVGKAWDLDQPPSNWINISDFALQGLKGRTLITDGQFTIPSFPSYTDWCIENDLIINLENNKDVFPPRAQLGNYLNERAISITNPLLESGKVKIYREKVIKAENYTNKVTIFLSQNISYSFDECLISIGHQPTYLSEEDKKNIEHSKKGNQLYIHSPYETSFLKKIETSDTIGIIGLGLTMIDVSRMLISKLNGTFKTVENSCLLTYNFDKRHTLKIIPYSFDGLLMVPKPYGRKIDAKFEPLQSQKNKFKLKVKNAILASKKISSARFFIDAFSVIASEIFIKNRKNNEFKQSEIKEVISTWLSKDQFQHDLILDTKLDPREYMITCIEMAHGMRDFTLDFTIGQVWRHLQPIMYRLFAFPDIEDKTIKEIIEIDERVKRYSYGPPVESILQLIALQDAGILDLSFANDPTVTLSQKGWKLKTKDKNVICPILINSVLDPPAISKISTNIIKNLREDKLINEVAQGLGAQTHPNGILVTEISEKTRISLLGRNAKGSIFGTDAILECFSPEIEDWAEALVSRI